MSIPGSSSPFLLAQQPGPYTIDRSVRFNSSDSAYLSRTPASAGNRKTWTWAGWVKRSTTALATLFGVDNGGGTSCALSFSLSAADSGKLEFFQGATTYRITTQVFRDLSAWMHIVLALDTTLGTATNRVKLYVNGTEVTSFDTNNNPSQNADLPINNTVIHSIGSDHTVTASRWHFNGYLADIHFIDGQALDPTSFGEFDATTGIWNPIAYSGSYGTNGFHLDFSDNSTAAALGYDAAGSNDWTVNNISVTAGAGNDSLVDVPTNGTETDTGVGGEVRGNYATLNATVPLKDDTLANGNLELTTDYATSSAYPLHVGTVNTPAGSGKWYWEINIGSAPTYTMIGIVDASESFDGRNGTGGIQYRGCAVYVGANGAGYTTGVGATYSGTPYSALTAATLVGVIFDADNGTLKLSYDGVEQAVIFTGISSTTSFLPCLSGYGDNITYTFNFGQRPFAYTAPSGFKALCTANLPAPVVTKPSEYMDVVTYTGNGSTQTISGLEFSPDLMWIKNRAAADSHKLTDTVRGATEELESDTTAAEATNADGLTAFNSDGFDLGADAEYNTNTETYVAWAWDAGTTTASNTDGSISSQVRANPSAGFSIVTYTGNGTAGATIGHGLGVAPEMIIVKNRDQADAWQVYHAANTANPETDYLVLNTTAATADNINRWNDTAPGASVFTLGDGAEVNTNTEDYVAYCFTGLDGYSNGFSYTGNGNSDGSFVYLGFRPRLILLKCSSTTGNWTLVDTAREGYNVDNDPLYPNLVNAEGTTDLLDITSNGFKLRTTDASVNANAATYIGFAWAESPFQFSRAR